MTCRRPFYWIASICAAQSLCACGVPETSGDSSSSPCAPQVLKRITGNTGEASVFVVDPIVSSGNSQLSPGKTPLDSYTTQVPLSRLSGLGVLDGQLVSIRNRVQCNDQFGAFDSANRFVYPHSDFRFQEAMSYYYGDLYQDRLKQNGYLVSPDPVVILAHCESVDNSYFTKAHDTSGQIYGGRDFNEVCLGDSKTTPGAYYADDSQVVIHELQHAATIDNYSASANLNQFFYDEAGGLNEGISDFMSLAFTDNMARTTRGAQASSITEGSKIDPKLFSRWALGTFSSKPNRSSVRGAHRCPMYDSDFPNCSSYPKFSIPTESGDPVHVSYIYPDGLGWPFPNNFKQRNVISSIYRSFSYNQEIHNNAAIITGALWELYISLKQNRGGDGWSAFNSTQKLILETVRHLPTPTQLNRTPVNFIQFAKTLVETMPLIADLKSEDHASVARALKERGLYQIPTIQSDTWVSVGPGTFNMRPLTPTPGVFIQDQSQVLAKWLAQMGLEASIVSQNSDATPNSMLDPGEVAVIWFDLQNNDDLTAGGVLLTVSSTDPDVEILDDTYNAGFTRMGNRRQAQIMYSKVHGKKMAAILSPVNQSPLSEAWSSMAQGNTLFNTDPFFGTSYRTGLWIKVKPGASHGKEVEFKVKVVPSNSSEELMREPIELRFPVTIQ